MGMPDDHFLACLLVMGQDAFPEHAKRTASLSSDPLS